MTGAERSAGTVTTTAPQAWVAMIAAIMTVATPAAIAAAITAPVGVVVAAAVVVAAEAAVVVEAEVAAAVVTNAPRYRTAPDKGPCAFLFAGARATLATGKLRLSQ
jgi:hypothetical protein